MIKKYEEGQVTIEWLLDPQPEDNNGPDTICIQMKDNYNQLERQLVLDKDNLQDVLDYIIAEKPVKKPVKYTKPRTFTRQEVEAELGLDKYPIGTLPDYARTYYSPNYMMFIIDDGGDCVYLKKDGNSLTMQCEIGERHGFMETVTLTNTQKIYFIKTLRQTLRQW